MAAVWARSWRKVVEEMRISPAWAWPAARYWASYPTEIDAEIAAADRAEDLAEQAWQREQRLLAG